MSDDFDGFFFLAYPAGDRSKVTVIDLMNCVSYERDEWANVNDVTYYTAKEAILVGRDLAARHGLRYESFNSRYNNEIDDEDIDRDEKGYIY